MPQIEIVEYVVGFNFVCNEVILIRKNKPEWQAGKLNGIGGKVEPGEAPKEAMEREYREETGDEPAVWEPFLTLNCPGVRVFFFKAFSYRSYAHTVTKETVECVPLQFIKDPEYPLIPNLRWIIPLALSGERGIFTYGTDQRQQA
jgi:8-oxo-dGTP diphosphatase